MSVVITGPGTGSGSLPAFVFAQASASTVWGPIAHNFGYRPSGVDLFSTDYSTQYDEFTVQHLDENSLRISMDQPTAGVALISR